MDRRLVLILSLLLLGVMAAIDVASRRQSSTPVHSESQIEELKSKPSVFEFVRNLYRAKISKPSSPQEAKQLHVKSKVYSILKDLTHLARTDQRGLDTLYAEIKPIVTDSPREFAEFFQDWVPQMSEHDLKKSLFLTKSLIEYSADPTPALMNLLTHHEPRPVFASGAVIHEIGMYENPDMAKAFAFDELRKRTLPDNSKRDLINTAMDLAEKEKNLSVVRSAVHFVMSFSDHASADFDEILHMRTPNEVIAFSDLKPSS